MADIPNNPRIPPGLFVTLNFLTPQTEQALISEIDSMPWSGDLARRTQHYGYKYNYKSGNVTEKAPDMPPNIAALAAYIGQYGLFPKVPEQVIVGEYTRNQGIAAHVDSLNYGPVIVGVSLGEDTVIKFRNKQTGEVFDVLVPHGSIYMMSGEARYNWTHEISKNVVYTVPGTQEIRKKGNNYRRISLTFRTLG